MGPLARWSSAWRDWRQQRVLERRPIPDRLWSTTLARYPFIAQRSSTELDRLRRLATLFLAEKEFTGAGGLQPTDEIAVAVAAQACLPILELGLEAYDGFVGIVIHPDEVVAEREVIDEDGIVHEYEETLTGEAMSGGPVMLSWRDVAEAGESAEQGYNVVIHEFVHVLDLRDGVADGVPLLPDASARQRWIEVLDREYRVFCDSLAEDPDPPIDPYGAEAPEEFFAVSSELFFVNPRLMAEVYPDLYRLLSGYFRQDPAAARGPR